MTPLDPSIAERHRQVETKQVPAPRPTRRICQLYGLAATLAVFCWQAATVHFNYGGNWTALYVTSGNHLPPPEIAGHTYLFRGSKGYDGQFYHMMAHAPWYRADWTRYFDAPRMRYRRVLVPGMAWLLALGQDQWVDAAYIAEILGWIFLGTYWLALYAAEAGYHPAWGLAFVLLPATLTSVDRMTVDVALGALCVAFLRYNRKREWVRLYVVLLLAPLVRDIGALLIAAQCCYELSGKRWRRAAGFATALGPMAAWNLYVLQRVPAVIPRRPDRLHVIPHWLFMNPGFGIVQELFRPADYPFGPALTRMLQATDALALGGFLVILAMAAWSLRRRPWDPEHWLVLWFVLLALATSAPSFWGHVYWYARPFSPFIFLAALGALRNHMWWMMAPVAFIVLRVLIQMSPQAGGILRGLL